MARIIPGCAAILRITAVRVGIKALRAGTAMNSPS